MRCLWQDATIRISAKLSRPSSPCDRFRSPRYPSRVLLPDVVLLGIMPERPVAHLQEFRRARAHAFRIIQRRENVILFQVLHMLFEVDSSLGNVRVSISVFRSLRRATLPPPADLLRKD